MKKVKVKVENAINENSIEDVTRITPEVVKKAAGKFNSGKSDPTFTSSSDYIKNGSDSVNSSKGS